MVAEIIKVVYPHRRNAAVVPDRGSRGSHVSDSRYGSRAIVHATWCRKH